MITWVSRARRRPSAGFTLIELLVVIVILGVLSAVVVFGVRGSSDRGLRSALATDRRTIETAEQTYCAKFGRFGTMDDLVRERFLSEASTYHSVTVTTPGPCGGTNFTVDALVTVPTTALTTTTTVATSTPTTAPDLGTITPAGTPILSIDSPAKGASLTDSDGRFLRVGRLDTGVIASELYTPAPGGAGSWAATTGQPVTSSLGTGALDAIRLAAAPCGSHCDKVLVRMAGGANGSAPVRWELFDPAGTWASTAGVVTQRNLGSSATLISGSACSPNCGKVLWVGGSDNVSIPQPPELVKEEQRKSAELYDPTKGVFTPTGGLNRERQHHVAVGLASGKVLVAGRDATFEIYDPASATWGAPQDLPGPLVSSEFSDGSGTATLLADGRVLFINSGNGNSMVYDPIANSWTQPLNCGCKNAHTATLLQSGKVLVAGGQLATRIYTPDAGDGSWLTGPNLSADRSDPTATRLPDGRVLVAGGAGAAASSADIYTPPAGS